jgi:hypothetical protein
MKNIKLIILLLYLTSCSSMEQAGQVLRNDKVKTTDEFLIKKKEPLVMPPDFNELPAPRSTKQNNNETDEEQKIKKIFKNSDKVEINTNVNTSTEKSILNRISK